LNAQPERTVKIGYHASHEQHPPGDLLRFVQLAEAAGFEAAMCSDHLMPFSERNANSGYAWSWLGAALQSTNLSFGTVNCPAYRYHPVIVAQAAATLADMYPGRFWLALGSGQYVNEHVTGEEWPEKEARNRILRESAIIIRKLLNGESVSCEGPVSVEAARLYVRPAQPPMLVGAAITPETAEFVGEWADALITVGGPREQMETVVRAFRAGGGEGKPIILQAQHSLAATDELAREAAIRNWRVAAIPSHVMTELEMPADIDAAAEDADPERILKAVRCSADPARHAEWLAEYRDIGFDMALIHNVQREDEKFIECYGNQVLPAASA
jgi:coenzyme F420-dependent glucose-6-phosphate dehydrogenase